jgi:hypothetical protein
MQTVNIQSLDLSAISTSKYVSFGTLGQENGLVRVPGTPMVQNIYVVY